MIIHYYKKLGVYLKFDESTMIYEAIRVDGNYVSYLKNVISESMKDTVINGFTQRNDQPSSEEEFNIIKQQALLYLNN